MPRKTIKYNIQVNSHPADNSVLTLLVQFKLISQRYPYDQHRNGQDGLMLQQQ